MTDRIIIIEHHASVVNGYLNWLQPEADMKVLGDADHPEKALSQFKPIAQNVTAIISDHSFSQTDVISAYIPTLRQTFPNAAILIITGWDFPHVYRELEEHGVDGILTKDDDRDCLLMALRTLRMGGPFYSNRVRQMLRRADPAQLAYDALTPMQQKVLDALGSGEPDKQVCDRLCIAASTLDNHRTAVFSVLKEYGFNIRSKSELVAWHAEHRTRRTGG